MREVCDLAVVGGGPAGMAAASLAAELGLEVRLYDEQGAPGGQIYRNVAQVAEARPGDLDLLGTDYRRGLDLVEAFRESGAKHLPGTGVWEVTGEGGLGLVREGAAEEVRARHLLLACGATERPVPLPGWTLPGVMGAGAAQTLLKASGLVPDVPTVIAGSGPLVYLVAWQLARAGAPLKALLLTGPRGRLRRAAPELPRALLAGDYLWKGLAWALQIRRLGVPVIAGVAGLAADGEARLEAVSYQTSGGRQRIEAGLLLLHEGVVPNLRLAMAAGCACEWDELQQAWRPRVDDWGVSSLARISLAGDGAGIAGARAAALRGRLAALEIARRLRRIDQAERDRQARPIRAGLARDLRVRRFLELYSQPAAAMLVPEDDGVIVCRCEEVTAGELRRVVALGCPGPNQAKAFTRCGMGACQGAMCGLTVSTLIADARRVPVGEVGAYRVRPPVKPVTVGEMAGLEGLASEPRLLGGLPVGGGASEGT